MRIPFLPYLMVMYVQAAGSSNRRMAAAIMAMSLSVAALVAALGR